MKACKQIIGSQNINPFRTKMNHFKRFSEEFVFFISSKREFGQETRDEKSCIFLRAKNCPSLICHCCKVEKDRRKGR